MHHPSEHDPVPPDAERVRDALRKVVDPEVGLNIVDLGLLYRVEVTPGHVEIDMTMTSPACPMGDMILDDVHEALDTALPADYEKTVNLVWEPPWNPSMMAARAKAHFGWEDGDTGGPAGAGGQ